MVRKKVFHDTLGMSTIEMDRVRQHTAESVNQHIDDTIAVTVHEYASRSNVEINQRLGQLDREWDIERWLQVNASSLALIGVGLGIGVDKRWFALTTGVLGFLLLHATQGWCPPLPMLRRMGVRTRDEINRERFALKYLRGDFAGVRTGHGEIDTDRLMRALER
jgi:hypothetical protein